MKPLTEKHLKILEHSLGGSNSIKWYRNYFVATEGHYDLPLIRDLEKVGYIKRIETVSHCDNDEMLFVVTLRGKKALLLFNAEKGAK